MFYIVPLQYKERTPISLKNEHDPTVSTTENRKYFPRFEPNRDKGYQMPN